MQSSELLLYRNDLLSLCENHRAAEPAGLLRTALKAIGLMWAQVQGLAGRRTVSALSALGPDYQDQFELPLTLGADSDFHSGVQFQWILALQNTSDSHPQQVPPEGSRHRRAGCRSEWGYDLLQLLDE